MWRSIDLISNRGMWDSVRPPSPTPLNQQLLWHALVCQRKSWCLNAPKLEQTKQYNCSKNAIFRASMASKCIKIQIKIHAIMRAWKCVQKTWNLWQISSKWEPEAAPKGAKASKTSPEVSQRLPEGRQKWQRSFKGGFRNPPGYAKICREL